MKASEEKDDKTPLPSEVVARKGRVEKIKAYQWEVCVLNEKATREVSSI
jgi:hypothetical protein